VFRKQLEDMFPDDAGNLGQYVVGSAFQFRNFERFAYFYVIILALILGYSNREHLHSRFPGKISGSMGKGVKDLIVMAGSFGKDTNTFAGIEIRDCTPDSFRSRTFPVHGIGKENAHHEVFKKAVARIEGLFFGHVADWTPESEVDSCGVFAAVVVGYNKKGLLSGHVIVSTAAKMIVHGDYPEDRPSDVKAEQTLHLLNGDFFNDNIKVLKAGLQKY